jgi:hypothetical protein
MKKAVFFIIFVLLCFNATAQDDQVLLDTFLRNFQKSEQIDTKVKILEDAVNYGSASFGPLYHEAVNYILTNINSIKQDTMLTQIAFLAIEEIKEINYTDSKYAVWELFKEDITTSMKISVLDTLSVIAKDDDRILENCIDWLKVQNTLFFTGNKPDNQVVATMIKTLGEFGDSSAFADLLTAKVLQYSNEITTLAENAMFGLEGNMKDMLMDVIENGRINEKKQALEMGLDPDNNRLNDTERSELAEFALEIAIYASTGDYEEKNLIRDMRFDSVNALSSAKWSKATSLIIEHFGMTLLEYDREIVAKSRLLEAIDALGSMQTHEAAERLTLYLEYINTNTEHGKIFDEQITLAVVNNLRLLGDKIAFADLTNTKYLNYGNIIKQAAQDAIDNLVW